MTEYKNMAHGQAGAYRRRGLHEKAGDEYTLRTWRRFAKKNLEHTPGPLWGVSELFYAAGCYRLHGDMDRCQNRCEQAILVVSDVRDNVNPHPDLENTTEAHTGLAYEYIADFRLLGDLGDYHECYKRARDQYKIVERNSNISQILGWSGEGEFHDAIQHLLRTARAVGNPVQKPTRSELELSLIERIDYKQEHFPDLLEALFDGSSWIWEEKED